MAQGRDVQNIAPMKSSADSRHVLIELYNGEACKVYEECVSTPNTLSQWQRSKIARADKLAQDSYRRTEQAKREHAERLRHACMDALKSVGRTKLLCDLGHAQEGDDSSIATGYDRAKARLQPTLQQTTLADLSQLLEL
eukprot:COSAG01_NODE_43089_length_433_cov_1.065868_1_plen_138_part_01